ncbi:MAG TPA: ATP-binding cassette domain-containing protein [Polyangia bacterium]|nr:ATP-binding cassette domain-containing protein [Polyangia bacterium]
MSASPAVLEPGRPLITVKALAVGYRGQAILPPLSITIGAGQFWSVIGPNGAGKSTFVRTVLGLERPVSGTVERSDGLRLGYVPQQGTLDPIFPISVRDFVLMGRQGPGNVIGHWRRADLKAAQAALAEADVSELARRQLHDLSGGQKQRVLMARAVAQDADVIFLDEPTAALDLPAEREVLALIERLRARHGAAVVMVTHLVEDGLERADHALLLDRDHQVAFAASAAEMHAAPSFQHLYGRFLARREVTP